MRHVEADDYSAPCRCGYGVQLKKYCEFGFVNRATALTFEFSLHQDWTGGSPTVEVLYPACERN